MSGSSWVCICLGWLLVYYFVPLPLGHNSFFFFFCIPYNFFLDLSIWKTTSALVFVQVKTFANQPRGSRTSTLFQSCSPWHVFSVALKLWLWFCQHSELGKTEISALSSLYVSQKVGCLLYLSFSCWRRIPSMEVPSGCSVLCRIGKLVTKCYQYFCPFHCNLFLVL